MAEEKLKITITGDSTSVKRAFGEVDKSIKTTEDKLKSAGRTMTSIGTKMSLAVTAPLVLIGKKSLDMAMDVVESENLFEVSMGNMADAAREWSETFSEAVGLNQYEVRKQVGTFNVMLKSMGLTEDAALDMSQGFTELAYDMASFYNLKPEEAFSKIKSGVVGMSRPLQDLGIIVNETTIQAYAYKNGIAELGVELTETQKVMARYGVIMERTSDAQGDMARTIESPANQMRIFKEQINLAMIELGKGLIPVMQKVIDIVKPYIEKFTNASDRTKTLSVNLGLVFAVAGPLLFIFGQLATIIPNVTKAYIGLNTAIKGSALVSLAPVVISLGTGLGLLSMQTAAAEEAFGDFDKVLEKVQGSGISAWFDKNRGSAGHYTIVIGELYRQSQKLEKQLPGITSGVRELSDQYLKGTIAEKELIDGLVKINQEAKNYIETSHPFIIASYQAAGSQKELAEETEETAEAIEEQTEAIDNLLKSLFKLYNLNQSVIEQTWDYEDAQKNLNEMIESGTASQREIEEATFGVQDAREDLIDAIWREYEADGTSLMRKRELKDVYETLAEEAVLSGEMSETAAKEMAKQFDVSGGDIVTMFGKIITKANETNEAIQGIEDKDVTVTVNYQTMGRMPAMFGGGLTQSGGTIKDNMYSSDLNIPLFKGEAVLPAPVVRAIKEDRGSFAGLDASGGGSITININNPIVREEQDIHKITEAIAEELYDIQETKGRLA